MREASRSGPSIRLKLVLVLTVAAAGVAVPILATYSNSQRLHLVDLTREEWRTTARTVAFGAAIGLSSGDYYDMKSALDWLLDKPYLVYVSVLDTRRNEVLTKNPARRQLFVPDAGGTTWQESKDLIEMCMTIERKDRRLGFLSLGFSTASLDRSLAAERHQAWTLGLGAFAGLLALAWGLGTLLDRQNTALAAARAEADRANRLKSAFLANMSHEIRTPMTAILGYANLLLDAEQSASDRVNYVQTIRRNGDHLLSIINDILDLSKIEAGRMAVERIACSPFQIISEVVSLMRVRAAEKKLELEVEYRGPIPQTIQTDPTRFREILVNLVGNAIKFTARGGVRIVADLADPAAAPEPRLRVAVIDSGVGMTREQAARIFQPFAQGDSSTTRRFGGTGLGLAISRHLAELLGGGIRVDSRPGEGSTFVMTVLTGPLAGVALLDGPPRTETAGGSGAPEPGKPASEPAIALSGRILLAEDGPDNQRLISYFLKKAGATVEIADNGAVAVEKALQASAAGEPFDLILMDMQMPELDGYGATSMLRQKGYAGPIIALTAHAMDGDRQKCLKAGCNDYTTKPIDRKQLLRLSASYIEKHAGERTS